MKLILSTLSSAASVIWSIVGIIGINVKLECVSITKVIVEGLLRNAYPYCFVSVVK